MWNGFTMISKRPELTEGMMETLLEAERSLQEAPGTAHIWMTKRALFHAHIFSKSY